MLLHTATDVATKKIIGFDWLEESLKKIGKRKKKLKMGGKGLDISFKEELQT